MCCCSVWVARGDVEPMVELAVQPRALGAEAKIKTKAKLPVLPP